ncbi:MAG TPA: response regulator, partial [Candidatus Binataceae bacterium]|nr:response regulator [Candidatus Binataceae bacterium]
YLVKPIARRELFRAIGRMLAVAEGIDLQGNSEHMPQTVAALPSNGRPMKILVAEDSADNRFVIETYLRKMPCSVTFAKDGQQAVDSFVSNTYDLVFMDVQMPNVDGLSATRSIRKWESDNGRTPIPIIALTASALEEDVAQSLQAGCDAHISKPVKKSVIVEAIRKAALHQPSPRVVLH